MNIKRTVEYNEQFCASELDNVNVCALGSLGGWTTGPSAIRTCSTQRQKWMSLLPETHSVKDALFVVSEDCRAEVGVIEDRGEKEGGCLFVVCAL